MYVYSRPVKCVLRVCEFLRHARKRMQLLLGLLHATSSHGRYFSGVLSWRAVSIWNSTPIWNSYLIVFEFLSEVGLWQLWELLHASLFLVMQYSGQNLYPLPRNPLGDKKICSIKRGWHGFIVLRLCGEKALSTHITAVEFFVLSIDPLLMMITIQRIMTQWSSGCLLCFQKSWLQYIWSCFYRHAAHCIGEQPRESLCSRVD